MVRTLVQPLPVGLLIAPPVPPGRIPVPVILAIGAEAHILGEAIEQPRSRSMWLVVGNGIRHLLQGVESLGLLVHKGLDAVRAGGLDVRHHVHQHQRRCLQVGFANRQEADSTTHRGSHQDRPRTPKRLHHTEQVLDAVVRAVLVSRCPP